MRKWHYLLILGVVLWWGCRNRDVNMGSYSLEVLNFVARSYQFHVLVIDGCQYLILEVDRNNPHEGFGFMAHRGNCPNPLHYDRSENALLHYPAQDSIVLIGRPLE